MRSVEINRKTNETDISLKLNIDGRGNCRINTGCGFLDHMLTLFCCHGRFDMTLECKGDTYVDYHHTVEDTALLLGEGFALALCDKRGIVRYGDCALPMDEVLVLAATDISGRPFLSCELDIKTEKVGDFDTELVSEFFRAFVNRAGITLHLRTLSGGNSHHVIECAFKAFARSLRTAVAIDKDFPDEILSTKGIL